MQRLATEILLLGLLAAGGAGAQSGPPAAKVLVVVSQDADPYQQALGSFRRELDRAVPGVTFQVLALHGDTAKLADAVEAAQRSHPALLLALGTLASRALIAKVHDTPIVSGMILNAGELAGAANATGVYLEYPVATELDWLKRVLPADKRVGVIYHSVDNGRRVGEAEKLGPGIDLSIESIRVEGPAELPDALETLGNRADVLWGLADPVVYNAETARSLLVFSLRNRIPLIGQSTAWVRAGALYALDRDYADVGAQCAELAAKVLGGEAPASLAPVPPRKVRYAINRHTAAEMKLKLSAKVLREAAEVVD